MKTINYEQFLSAVAGMYNNHTAFVYVSDGSTQFESGDINDETTDCFRTADEIQVHTLDELSYISAVMLENMAAELKPHPHVQDDNYVSCIRTMFGEDSRILCAVKGDEKAYVLIYG